MRASLALIHHANQFLITNGYENREGIADIVGWRDGGQGMAAILKLHAEYKIPLNLHVSGTLLESIAWHCPSFLGELRDHLASGLVELVGSCYGQNIMRFFSPEYNQRQLQEELWLYESLLGWDPHKVTVFWPPERVWETRRMAPVLRDATLRNGGYRYVVLDDRALFSHSDPKLPRMLVDGGLQWSPEMFQAHEIENGLGLIALPIATRLRRSVPPKDAEDWQCAESELEALLVHGSEANCENLLAVYADDMEKVIGVWGAEAPARYREFLEWISQKDWITPVKLGEWASNNAVAGRRPIEIATFDELANEFEAGEGYEQWFHSDLWKPYREHFEWATNRVKECKDAGADAALIELAEKQLLVSNWETAWHTPKSGPHGDPEHAGQPSPWARALTSHSRHAAVTAEAALWARNTDGLAHAESRDVDHDGEPDLVLRNGAWFALCSPRWGGRIISLYSISSGRGALTVGNPCDDWNFLEDLNQFMETPRNHPGAFADVGFENDEHSWEVLQEGETARVRLVNIQQGSQARGLEKIFQFSALAPVLEVHYVLPAGLPRLSVETGLSPDYLHLLRTGSSTVSSTEGPGYRGLKSNGVSVILECDSSCMWETPIQQNVGHARTIRIGSGSRRFRLGLRIIRDDVVARVA